MGKDFNISVLGDSVNVHVMNKELRKNKKSAGSQGFVFFVQEPRRGSSQAFIVDPETSDTIQLTDTKGEGGRFQNFMLAPETNTLFFGNNGSAFSIGLEDSNLTSLGFGFGTYDSYFFASPDGSRFVSSGAGGRLRSFDNGEVIRKIQSKPPGGIINECDFSPDGSKLAFRSAPGRSYVIHIADLESGTVEHLTSSHQSNTFPKWSPDGKKIAYISAPNDRRSDIWVSDVDTRDATKLTNVGPVFSFSWSPDGKKIVLDHGRKSDDYREIYVVDVDSGNLNRLTTNQELDEYPTFSPEGSRIAYASWVDGVPEVYVMDVDGKNKKRLTYTDKSRKRQLHWVDTH